ncbi:ROK family protein [Caldanaerobacter subterraneus KAk]|uniref:ROK family protein n=1 Tax=Caldanaerobacter subterraneus TaxID=911092 RepID=UPI0032C04A31
MKVIGIDIGGTKILGGLIDETGNLLEETLVYTEAHLGREKILENLFIAIDKVIDKNVKGIGIGSAGRINFEEGIVEYATDNLPGWTGCNLKQLLEDKYKIPAIVDNDVNAAVIGEMWQGAGRGYKDIVMIAIGTGVGGAVVCNGEVIRGKNWSAGEIGHMVLYPNGRQCNCGQKGCLEQYVSGTAIARTYRELSKEKKIAGTEEVFLLAEKGDKVALEVVNDFVNSLSIAILSLKNLLDPEIFIIGGGVIGAKRIWWDKLKEILKGKANITPAQLENKATMVGAAKLMIDFLENDWGGRSL